MIEGMRWLCVILTALALSVSIWADGPDDSYVQAYQLIQEADTFGSSGQTDLAKNKYGEAQAILKKLQTIYPDWNALAVKFRLNYIDDRLAGKAPPPSAGSPATPAARTTPGVSTRPAPKPAPSRPDTVKTPDPRDAEIAGLNERVAKLTSDNAVLEAKLKEALSAQPTGADPREFAKAEERIKALEKERDLLKVSLDQEQSAKGKLADPATVDKLQNELKENKNQLAQQQELVSSLTQEKKILEGKAQAAAQLEAAVQSAKAETESLKQQLSTLQKESATSKAADAAQAASTTATIQALEKKVTQLEQEKTALEAQLKTASAAKPPTTLAPPPAATVATPPAVVTPPVVVTPPAVVTNPKTATPAKTAELEKTIEKLRTEKSALEKEKKTMEAQAKAPAASRAESGRIKQLEKERDELLKKLNETNRERYEKKAKGQPAQVADLTREIASLRTRLASLEAKKEPYTAEELALFNSTPLQQMAVKAPTAATNTTETAAASPAKAGVKPQRRTAKELPAGAGLLDAEAKRAFAAKRYKDAENRYLQILKLDDHNIYTLANLAAAQLEASKFDDAEKNLKAALAQDPDDGYSLSLLGILKFRQDKYDDAFEILSRAAELDPLNPETQNYLGITLSQRGQRGPAEAALRKALQLDPRYGGAHHNLAVIYATQQPPFLELAKWHYQKALSAGHAPNADLEKMLNAAK